MKWSIKRLFTALLAGVVIFTSGFTYSGSTIISNAAEITSFKELEKQFPIGAVLYSDTFPGLLISYNRGDSYTIKDGDNNITLDITMLDKSSAQKSIPALKLLFGKTKLPDKVGETTQVSGGPFR